MKKLLENLRNKSWRKKVIFSREESSQEIWEMKNSFKILGGFESDSFLPSNNSEENEVVEFI
jgi:hypothetical protein